MSRWGKPTKNKRRRDPRYFLNESVEGEETLNEFELGFDVDDDSDEKRARDLEWIERERKQNIPATEAVLNFLTSDEPAAMGMAKSSLMTRIKYFNALLKFLKDQNEEFYLQMYALGVGRDDAMNESMSDPDGESPIAKMGKEKGFPKAVAAMQGLAKLNTHGAGNNLVKAADKKYFKGRLGQEMHGAQGIAQYISDSIRNARHRRDDGPAPKQDPLDRLQWDKSLEEMIKEELTQVISEVKIDGYDYGLRGRDRLEFNMAMRNDPGAAREVANMSVERVGDWWEDYKIKQDEYEPPPGDPGPRGHPYDYPPGQEGRYKYSDYGYEE